MTDDAVDKALQTFVYVWTDPEFLSSMASVLTEPEATALGGLLAVTGHGDVAAAFLDLQRQSEAAEIALEELRAPAPAALSKPWLNRQ